MNITIPILSGTYNPASIDVDGGGVDKYIRIDMDNVTFMDNIICTVTDVECDSDNCQYLEYLEFLFE